MTKEQWKNLIDEKYDCYLAIQEEITEMQRDMERLERKRARLKKEIDRLENEYEICDLAGLFDEKEES